MSLTSRSRPLSSLLQLLKAQAATALSDDAKIQREVRAARELLGRVSEASVGALRQLEATDQALKHKWEELASLLGEVKRLESERAAALEMARQFRAAMAKPNGDSGDENDEVTDYLPTLTTPHGSGSPWRASNG